MNDLLQTANHNFWRQRVNKEFNSMTSFNNVAQKLKNKSRNNTSSPVMVPFRIKGNGKLFRFEKPQDNASDPCTLRDLGATPFADPRQNSKQESISILNSNSIRSKNTAKLTNTSSMNSKLSKNDFVASLIKRSNSPDADVMLKKCRSELMNKDIDEQVSNSARATMVKNLKEELERQSAAKFKVLNILAKLKEQGVQGIKTN